MSMSRSGSGAAASRGLPALALGCLLVAGCASAERGGTAQAPERAAVDRLNTTYTVTCDGIVPDGFPVTVVDGAARVLADSSRPPFYEHFDIEVADTAVGDVDGDAAQDVVVLLDCAPQPSNGVVQEVQVVSATGRLLGTLPSPRTLQAGVQPPPVYDAGGLSVVKGEVVAEMTAYGPEDSHATGPSVPVTLRWRFDGEEFVQVSS
jgi:hypothetical protein